MDPDSTYLLARTLANEAGVCGVMAMVAVAYVWSRNPRMTGTYGPREPGQVEWFVARTWHLWPDFSKGATFVFSDQDLRLPAVQDIIRNHGPPFRIPCAGGLGLNFVGWKQVTPRLLPRPRILLL